MSSPANRIEGWLYAPRGFWQRFLLGVLTPLGWLLCAVGWRRLHPSTPPITPPLPTISVGNLTVGGTGKTPLIAALAARYAKPAIILRGYRRKSRGCQLIAHERRLCATLVQSGDEAMLYHRLLPWATVIVSADRLEAIAYAHRLGATVAFLDDAFRHRHIEKLDLLIAPTPTPENRRCLPAGPYRLPPKAYQLADRVVQEGVDFTRRCTIVNPTEKMVLMTAIARPERLEPFLPDLQGRCYFPDHHPFTHQEASEALKRHQGTSLLVTEKDAVKLESFNLPLSYLTLTLEVGENLHQMVADYTLQKGGDATISPKNPDPLRT